MIALPVAALGIGLLIAWIVHRSGALRPPGWPRPPPSPSHPGGRVGAAVRGRRTGWSSPPTGSSRPSLPPGLTFRHPPGWIRRTALPEILRFAPASAGSTTPGVEGVGAGIEPNADPSQALPQFVTRAYGTSRSWSVGRSPPVAGAHPGEQQQVVTLRQGRRAGSRGRARLQPRRQQRDSVIVLARAASAQPARAAQLEAAVEASLQLSG